VVKLFAVLSRREGMGRAEFLEHWHHHHGPLIADTPELARHLRRYVQHPRASDGPLSGSVDCDGVAEQWFDSLDDFAAFLAEPAYAELIAPDERRFLDMDRVRFVICDEPVVQIGDDA